MGEKFFKLRGGGEIFFKKIPGNEEKPVLVFLHEGLGCIEMWKGFPDLVCDQMGFPGLVFDREGYGRSSPLKKNRTKNYMHDYALNELPEVISGLIPGKRFFLIGHSDGGSIALIYSSVYKENLLGIIVEAPHISVEEKALTGIRKAVEAFKAGRLDSLKKYHSEKTEAVFFAWANTWLSESFRDWNIRDCLKSISCPVLVIQGKKDQYATDDQVNGISEIVQSAQSILIDDSGHSPHLEKDDLVLSCIARFIKGLFHS